MHSSSRFKMGHEYNNMNMNDSQTLLTLYNVSWCPKLSQRIRTRIIGYWLLVGHWLVGLDGCRAVEEIEEESSRREYGGMHGWRHIEELAAYQNKYDSENKAIVENTPPPLSLYSDW
jgi:hypothetical protein